MALPKLLPVPQVRDRLRSIFPDGTPFRNYVTRRMAARTVFVMLYTGAVEGSQRWLRPDQVTRMTDDQAQLAGEDAREAWSRQSMRPASGDILGRWYAANTREPIRDETLRAGLVRTGAVKEREGLATTSPRPRYALAKAFAGLFDPGLAGEDLASAIRAWRKANLSRGALARVAIMRRAGTAQEGRVLVTFPDGEARHMEPGPSSVLSKAVIEPDRNLPDLILVDLDPSEPLLVFVEVVATAGHVSEARQTALMEVATEAGFEAAHVAFVTAYADRDDPAFKASVSELAWRSFVWFMSEPQHLLVMQDGDNGPRRLSELMS